MKEYYYIDRDNRQTGPLSFEELKQRGIEPQTPVWYAGLQDWTPAGQLPDFAGFFGGGQTVYSAPYGASSQPIGQQSSQPQPYNGQPKPDNWLAWSIVCTILCCLPFGIPGIIYASKVDSCWMQGRYDEARDAAGKAKMWTLISLGVGLAVYLLYIIVYAVMLGGALFPLAAMAECY